MLTVSEQEETSEDEDWIEGGKGTPHPEDEGQNKSDSDMNFNGMRGSIIGIEL